MLKSGSDMMAAAERKVHSFEEFEALKCDGKLSALQPKKQSKTLCLHVGMGLRTTRKINPVQITSGSDNTLSGM